MVGRLALVCLSTICLSLSTNALDVRVSPVLGAHGRNMVRLSVIDKTPSARYGGFFDYNENFKGRWEEYALHSKVVRIEPGVEASYEIPTAPGSTYRLTTRLPPLLNGTSGIVFGDPCAWRTGFFLKCVDKVGPRLSSLLDTQNSGASSRLDYWMILGDNFYDKKGKISGRFFDLIDRPGGITNVPLITTPGNHDYWLLGSPKHSTKGDQFGHGFMQYYAQDTMAGRNTSGGQFIDFSGSVEQDAPQANFQQYKQMGNTGFLVYSGAYNWEAQLPFFREACSYFGEEKPAVILLASHWSKEDNGCAPGMDVVSARKKILELPGCQIGGRMKGLFGHTHCNKVVDPDNYLIGGSGFLKECSQAGFVWISTLENRLRVVEFDYGSDTSHSALLSCMQRSPLEGCLEHGNVWADEPL